MKNLRIINKNWSKGFWTEVTCREFIRCWKVYMESFEGTYERVDEKKVTGPQVTYFDDVPLFRVTNMLNMKRDGYYINSKYVKDLLELSEGKLGPIPKKSEVLDFEDFYNMRYK